MLTKLVGRVYPRFFKRDFTEEEVDGLVKDTAFFICRAAERMGHHMTVDFHKKDGKVERVVYPLDGKFASLDIPSVKRVNGANHTITCTVSHMEPRTRPLPRRGFVEACVEYTGEASRHLPSELDLLMTDLILNRYTVRIFK